MGWITFLEAWLGRSLGHVYNPQNNDHSSLQHLQDCASNSLFESSDRPSLSLDKTVACAYPT